jgi:ubiquinone/menaquinone biosynthesis C-methylase UbiE
MTSHASLDTFRRQKNEKSEEQNLYIYRHYDKYVADYTESNAYLWKIQRIFELVQTKPLKILDVGCSSGAVLSYANQFFGPEIACGIEISQRAISIGKKKYPKISFVKASATHLPFRSDVFDLVTCLNCLEHFSKPEVVVSCIDFVIKGGGTVAVVVPNELTCVTSFMVRITKPVITKIRGKEFIKEHLINFTPNSIIEMFSRNFDVSNTFADSLLWMDWPYTVLLDKINLDLKFFIANKLTSLMKHKPLLYVTGSMSLVFRRSKI